MTDPIIQRDEKVTTVETTPAETSIERTQTLPAKRMIFKTYQIVWFILGVIEAILALRVVLKLLGANSGNPFTNFIYQLSDPLALPFAGILGTARFSNIVFEWSTLIAMAIYALIAWGIVALLQIIKPSSVREVEETLDKPK